MCNPSRLTRQEGKDAGVRDQHHALRCPWAAERERGGFGVQPEEGEGARPGKASPRIHRRRRSCQRLVRGNIAPGFSGAQRGKESAELTGRGRNSSFFLKGL